MTRADRAGSAESFWALLTAADRRALSDLGRNSTFRPRSTMCVEGEPATHVFILLDGWVKVFSVTKDGRTMILALRGQGDIVGEMAGETTGTRMATMQAIDLVRTLIVGHERFGSFLESHPDAQRAYRRVIMQRWSDAAEMLRIRPVTTGAQRLARLLLDLAERHGTKEDGEIHVVMPLSQDELASLVGTSRATVTRAYNDWRRRGLIRTGQRHITITDPPGLGQLGGLPRTAEPETAGSHYTASRRGGGMRPGNRSWSGE